MTQETGHVGGPTSDSARMDVAFNEPPLTAGRAPELAAVWANRDLGWLEFNRRVLAEAQDGRVPLLERVKFLAIFASNLDEFFMKRIAALREDPTPTCRAVVAEVRERLNPLLDAQAAVFRDKLIPELGRHGVHLRRWADLTHRQTEELHEYFDWQISPALTPLVIHPSQPLPFFSNLSTSFAFTIHDARDGTTVYGRVKVPSALPPWVAVTRDVAAGEHVLVRLQDVIGANLAKLYPGMELSSPTLFRLTRDAEVELDDDEERGVREVIREQLRQRRFEPAVRLEFAAGADPEVRTLLQQRFALADHEVYNLSDELDFTGLFQIAALELPGLRDAPWTPVTPVRVAEADDIFEVVREADLLVHHPYESFDETVEQFIDAAAADPLTVAIKMTVYRVGDDTPFVRSLIRAAEAGKQVACVIELKARFDEARNLHWAGELERAGAHVTVGDLRLKTHAKVSLVVRREADGLRSYAHIGTGNYHVRTARTYTDIGLLTAAPAMTADVVRLFHHLTGRSEPPSFNQLLVAPTTMRDAFLARINGEIAHHRAGRPARIIAKMNQLEDPTLIAALCAASGAGVPIDLIVRGFCCLRPGVAGFSDSIRVRSIIGRFLEHSRIFYFAAGQEDPDAGEFLIGSADWMVRNLSRRVEVVVPVHALEARQKLWEILTVTLEDRRQAWIMHADGSYTRAESTPSDSDAATLAGSADGMHATLMELAKRRVLLPSD